MSKKKGRKQNAGDISPAPEKQKVNKLHLIRRFAKKILADRTTVYSAQAAFYLIMSFAPMLFLVLTFLKYTPLTEEDVLEMISFIVNEEMMENVRKIVNSIYHGSFRFFSFAAVSLLWVSGAGMMGLSNGLNSIYSLKENRNYLVKRLRCSFYALLLVFAFVLSLGVLVFGFRSRNVIAEHLPFFVANSFVSAVCLVVLALILLTFIFDAMYVFLPNRKRSFFSQIYGALFTTLSWCVFSFFFGLYLHLSKNLSILYGGLITIIMSLLWLYFCLLLFFFGAELNAWVENSDEFPF